MAKDCQIVVHVERVVRDAFAALASEDGRKVSAYAERVLIAHLEKKKPKSDTKSKSKAKRA